MNDKTLWNLSSFKVDIVLRDRGGGPGYKKILRLGPHSCWRDISAAVASLPLDAGGREQLKTSIDRIIRVFNARNNKLLKPLPRQSYDDKQQYEEMMKGATSETMLCNAIRFAGIDLPGEDRITQDLRSSVVGNISSRTRLKCRSKANFAGLLAGSKPLINADGLLSWKYYWIESVTWKNDRLVCQVATWSEAVWGAGKRVEKVDIEALSDQAGAEKLYAYFHNQLNKEVTGECSRTVAAKRNRAQRLNNQPSPKEARQAFKFTLPELAKFNIQERGEEYNPAVRCKYDPRKLPSRWDRLEKEWLRKASGTPRKRGNK
ncbi:hypothetical protein F4778DRAFT_790641 [Xylariomycetidae sp. FL2044]|nr:hypothetical protein F4778DRAFT_790641 [Xylariomycetidae sp. FL2044]